MKNYFVMLKRILRVFAMRDKVSIVVTCYNCEKTIERTINTLIKQIYRNIEIILIDDCSTDNTKNILETYESKYSNVKCIYLDKNGGTYIAKNHGMAISTGKILAFNDAGDLSSRWRILLQLLYIAKHGIIGCFCSYVRVDESGALIPESKGKLVRQALIGLVVHKKPVIAQAGFYDSIRMSGDSEYIGRLRRIFGFKQIKYYEKVLYTAIEEKESLTVSGVGAFKICAETGKRKGPKIREDYANAYKKWHSKASKKDLHIPFPLHERKFDAPRAMLP